jgi:hypothetical protein
VIGGSPALTIEEPGDEYTPDALRMVFEPSGGSGRPGIAGLEMAASLSIARRTRTKLRAEARPGGGLVIVAEFPTTPLSD